jgi:hypothetical protein
MAGLILEVTYRHETRYIPLTRPVTRLGRGLDNDVILNDPTVSAHHLVIKADAAGQLWLHPISDENGVTRNGRVVDEPLPLGSEPLVAEAGRTQLRILPTDHPVAATRRLRCSSGALCLFGSWLSAALLFGAFTLVSLVDNYWSTPQRLTWDSFGRDQVVILTVVLLISGGLTVLVRLLAHRWEPASALSFVSLMVLLATLLDQFAAFADYALTTAFVGFTVELTWAFIIAPVAIFWFLVHVNHAGTLSSLLVALMLLTPSAYFNSREAITYFGFFGSFSDEAHYPDELHPVDIHRSPSMSSDDYIIEMARFFDRQ